MVLFWKVEILIVLQVVEKVRGIGKYNKTLSRRNGMSFGGVELSAFSKSGPEEERRNLGAEISEINQYSSKESQYMKYFKVINRNIQ